MDSFYSKEQKEIIDSFETVDIVLRAYFEKEINNDNMIEAKRIDNLLYEIRHFQSRLLIDFSAKQRGY